MNGGGRRRWMPESVRRACVVCALAALWLGTAGTGRAQELPFSHYTPEGGVHRLPSASIALVYQDTLGFLWISAFSSGLVRYDGHASELYTTEDGLRDLGIQNLVEDVQGRLWAGSRGGVVVSEEPLAAYAAGRRIRFESAIGETALTGSSVRARAMALDADGWMWVGTQDEGLLRYDTRAPGWTTVDTLQTVAADGRAADVASIAAGHGGSVWVGFGEGELVRYERGRPSAVVASAQAFGGSYPTALHEDRAGVLWIGTGSGHVYRATFTGGKMAITVVERRLGGGITDVRASADGSVWVASEGGGLLRVGDGGAVLGHYTRANGLLNDTVTRVLQDREGNLWFAQLGGVSKLRHNFDAFRNFTAESHQGEQPVLPAPSVSAVVEAPPSSGPCRLWAATSGGGVACIGPGGESAYLRSSKGLYGDYVNALAVDADGRLWIGSTRGIQRLSFGDRQGGGRTGGRTVDVLGAPARLVDFDPASVFSISVVQLPAGRASSVGAPQSGDRYDGGPVESTWFAQGAGLSVHLGESWYALQSASGLPRDRMHAVAADEEGRIWVATRSMGIYRSVRPITAAVLQGASEAAPQGLPGGQPVFEVVEPLFEPAWSTASGAPVDEVYDMLWHGGQMWAATASGVVALSGDTVRTDTHLTEGDGLGDDFTMSLSLSPGTGTLWVGTNGGLSEIDPAAQRVVRTVTKEDGLADSEVWYVGSVEVARDGTVHFGTAGGLAAYRPAYDAPNPVAPLLAIRRVIYADNDGRNEIDVEYAALSFVNESQVRYRTRLVGYDADWSAEKTDARIRYTNLPAVFLPRSYRFEVLARNGDGVWPAAPATYSFSVLPPLWLRWWAMSLYAVVLALGAVFVSRYQKARLLKEERERAQLREAELAAEAALARSEAAEAQAKALASDNERKEVELEKARELKQAYGLVQKKNEENERLLLNILPVTVAERLKGGEHEIADSYPEVTILFSDLVGFTSVASRTPASELVHILNLLFSEFDRLALSKGIEKIKTIGDAYMAVVGLPEEREDHACVMADMALDMIDSVQRLNAENGLDLSLRIGMHSGSVTAGVIGMHKFAYDVWGDAVNTAARMESHGVPGRVHVSDETGRLIAGAFDLELRGIIDVKGKGSMKTYFVTGRKYDVWSPEAGTTVIIQGIAGLD